MYTLLDVRVVNPGAESKIETAFYRAKGLDAVIKLLNDPRNVPTNFVITFSIIYPALSRI